MSYEKNPRVFPAAKALGQAGTASAVGGDFRSTATPHEAPHRRVPDAGERKIESEFRNTFFSAPAFAKTRMRRTPLAPRDAFRSLDLGPIVAVSAGLLLASAAARQRAPPIDESPSDTGAMAEAKVKAPHLHRDGSAR